MKQPNKEYRNLLKSRKSLSVDLLRILVSDANSTSIRLYKLRELTKIEMKILELKKLQRKPKRQKKIAIHL